MNKLLFLLIAAILLQASAADAAQKYALLIGVAKYEHAEMNKPEALQFPEEDAKALAELLQSGGYEVELLLGEAATQTAIKAKLEALKEKADADGVVLIGLFGHGVELDTVDGNGIAVKDGCFCPYDTKVREALDYKGKPVFVKKQAVLEPSPDSLIKLGDLMRTLRLAKAGNRIVLADCCRTTPNAPRGRSSFGANFDAHDLPENTSLLFGCSPNEQAFEHPDWSHGAFTKCLLESIGELSAAGEVDTAQLASQMKKRVPALVASVSPRDKQTPKSFFTDVVDLQLGILKSLTASSEATTKMKPDAPPASPTGSNVEDMLSAGTDHGETRLVALDDTTSIELIWCESGDYVPEVGSTTEVNGFWMSKHEITREEWWSVMKSSPWEGASNIGEGLRIPATHVNWPDAQLFGKQLTQRLRKSGQLSTDWYFTLPTGAQWEYACRAGTRTAYFFGDTLESLQDFAWAPSNSMGTPIMERYAHPVALKKPNPWGFFDMAGNVREWCRDIYSGNILGEVTTGETSQRAIRGGSWLLGGELTRSSATDVCGESYKNSDLGFRIVLCPVE